MVTMVTSTGEKAEVFYGALWGGGEKHTARTHVGSNKLRGVDDCERFEVQDTTGLLRGARPVLRVRHANRNRTVRTRTEHRTEHRNRPVPEPVTDPYPTRNRPVRTKVRTVPDPSELRPDPHKKKGNWGC